MSVSKHVTAFVRAHNPSCSLVYTDWSKLNGVAACGLLELIETAPRSLAEPLLEQINSSQEPVAESLRVALLLSQKNVSDEDAFLALSRLEPRLHDELAFEMSLYAGSSRSNAFWIHALDLTLKKSFAGQNRTRIERRIEALRSAQPGNLDSPHCSPGRRLRALNFTRLAAEKHEHGSVASTLPHSASPSVLRHFHLGRSLGHSIRFNKAFFTAHRSIAIDCKFLSPSHEGVYNKQFYEPSLMGLLDNHTKAVPVASAFYPAYYRGTPNHYHRVVDLFASLMLASEICPASGAIVANLNDDSRAKLETMCRYFGRNSPEFTSLEDFFGHHGKAVLAGDFFLTKASFAYLALLREQVFVPERNSRNRKKFYVSRRFARTRLISNELECEKLLAARGFEIVHLESLNFAEQISVFQDADCIIAPHGAGLANMVFASASCRFLELGFEDYPSPLYVHMAAKLCILNYELLIQKSGAERRYDLRQLAHQIELMDLEGQQS